MKVNNHRNTKSIPKWLIEMLPKDKQQIMYEVLKDVYRAGFNHGVNKHCELINENLNELKKLIE